MFVNPLCCTSASSQHFVFIKRGTYGVPLSMSESILLCLSCNSLGIAAPISVIPESGQHSTLCRWVPMPHQQRLPLTGMTQVRWHRSSLGFANHWLSSSLYIQYSINTVLPSPGSLGNSNLFWMEGLCPTHKADVSCQYGEVRSRLI